MRLFNRDYKVSYDDTVFDHTKYQVYLNQLNEMMVVIETILTIFLFLFQFIVILVPVLIKSYYYLNAKKFH